MMCSSGLKTDEERMVNYSDMTDFEINRRVAQCMGLAVAFKQPFGDAGLPEVRLEAGQGGYFNPCNSWADAGPIIEKNNISVDKMITGGWMAYDFSTRNLYRDENPRRAAMIVYLMMHDKGEIYE